MIKTILIIPKDCDEPPHTENNKKYFINSFEHECKNLFNDLHTKCKTLNISIEELVGEFKYEVVKRDINFYFPTVFFTAWSKDYVFVRGKYDGSYWIEAIKRNPSEILCEEIGGG